MPYFPTPLKCVYEWGVKCLNNKRTLVLKDTSCGAYFSILSKEKLKDLLDKKRLTNLQYLEGLDILLKLRQPKKEH